MLLVDSFKNRLKIAMDINNMKQVDLVNKTKLDKTLINKYLAGIMKAKQDKLTILADALNVNEVWLIGYDVPMNRNLSYTTNITQEIKQQYGIESVELLNNYQKLNKYGKQKANENIKDLTEIPKYTENSTI